MWKTLQTAVPPTLSVAGIVPFLKETPSGNRPRSPACSNGAWGNSVELIDDPVEG